MTRFAVGARNLTRAFGGKRVVSQFSLDVPVGRVFGLLGFNRAGKTTLIRLLLGLIRPTERTSRVLGCGVRASARALGYVLGRCPACR